MAAPRGGQNAGHYYSNITMPQEIAISFVVAQSDSGGLGVTSVKSNGWVRNVFMNTNQTPGSNNGMTNPDPDAGYLFIQLNNNYNVFLGMNYSFIPPVTGAALTSVTTGAVYQIVSLGSTTAAQWATVGLPAGVTAAVGQSFVAIATASIGGTGTVKAVTTSGVFALELVGDPSASVANSNIGANGGAYLCAKFLNSSGTATNPTAGTIVNLRLYYDRSSVTIDGL